MRARLAFIPPSHAANAWAGGRHIVLCLSIAFRVTMSFRMHATRATKRALTLSTRPR